MWTNWGGSVSCAPATFERPRTRDEVSTAIAAAAAAGRTVRAVGAGHTFSDIAVTDGAMLHLGALDRVLDVDRDSGLVRVEAGITLRALNRALLAHGLALPNLGDIDVQALAGALATATHGTGALLGNISTSVAAMEIAGPDGSVRTIREADGDLLRAARVALGSLGVVVAVTLRCVPAFRLHGVDTPMALEDVLDALDEHVDGNDHFEFWTFPHSRVAITRTNNRTDRPRAPLGPVRGWVSEVLLDNHAFHALNHLACRAPGAIPAINRLAGRAASRRERVDWSFEIFASPRLVPFVEMEYAVPRTHARQALLETKDILERHPVSFPIELRFVAADDALLSPSHGRHTAYIAVHLFHRADQDAPFREVEALMGRWGGRPHWGKRSFLVAEDLSRRYPRWDGWLAARDELDPDGRFASAWTRRVLTGSSDPRRDRSEPRPRARTP
jgi:L-gulono-1,4-lactone dehydrogenase